MVIANLKNFHFQQSQMAGKIKRSSFYYTRAVADIRRNQSFQLKYVLRCTRVVIKINMTKMKVKK